MPPFNFFIESSCLAFSVAWLRKARDGYWHSLPWFMLTTCLFEGAGWLIRVSGGNNHQLYNIEMLVEVGYTAWLFYKIYQPMFNSRPWIITGLVVFLVSYSVETAIRLRNHPLYDIYNNTSCIISELEFIIASGFYYYLLLRDEAHIDLFTHPPFWLVTGLFLFYFGTTVASTFFQELLSIHLSNGIPIRFIVFLVLNSILYGCWIYAFRCRYRQVI